MAVILMKTINGEKNKNLKEKNRKTNLVIFVNLFSIFKAARLTWKILQVAVILMKTINGEKNKNLKEKNRKTNLVIFVNLFSIFKAARLTINMVSLAAFLSYRRVKDMLFFVFYIMKKHDFLLYYS